MRWIRFTFAGVGVTLFLIGTVLWIRSFWYSTDLVTWTSKQGGSALVGAIEEHLVFGWSSQRNPRGGGFEFTQETRSRSMQVPFWVVLSATSTDRFSILGIKYHHIDQPPDSTTIIAIPFAYLVVLFLLLCAGWFFFYRNRTKHYRRKHGLCLYCGYDLRGTTSACPECGRAANASTKVT